MRTIVTRITLTFALVLFVCLAKAAEPLDPAAISAINSRSMEQAVMHQINRFICFPLEGDQDRMYGVVEVAFVVNTEGHLVIVGTDSDNQDLRDYVVRKLARIHVGPNPTGLWNTSHVRFTFHPQV